MVCLNCGVIIVYWQVPGQFPNSIIITASLLRAPLALLYVYDSVCLRVWGCVCIRSESDRQEHGQGTLSVAVSASVCGDSNKTTQASSKISAVYAVVLYSQPIATQPVRKNTSASPLTLSHHPAMTYSVSILAKNKTLTTSACQSGVCHWH